MKKYILFLLLTTLCASLAAQNLSIVVNNGLNYSSFYFGQKRYIPKENRKKTPYFDCSLRGAFNQHFALTIGVGREERGYNQILSLTDLKVNYKYIYITMPVSLEYKFKNRLSPLFSIGFVPSFRTFGDVVSKEFGSVGNGLDFNHPGAAVRFDLALTTGTGLSYKISEQFSLNLATKLYRSITSTNEDQSYHVGLISTLGISYHFM